MKRLSGFGASVLALLSLGVLIISSGCSPPKPEGFAIYLTAEDIPPMSMINLSHFDLADKPVISMADIVSYNGETHEIRLTDGAFERIAALQVPVEGKSFVVCVDKKTIYWGAFWTPISSISFDGVTIWKPLGTQEANIIQLTLGYPTQSFYGGTDPRGNADVMQALDKAGKLITTFPQSMKGYELYSWQQDSQWHFTLITGTNRNKTLDEITADADIVTGDGWVQIHVVGVDAINSVLARLPRNEEVFWLTGLREPVTTSSVTIALPAISIIKAVEDHAQPYGLKIVILPVSSG